MKRLATGMRILFFIDSLGGGGAQRQLVNIALGLAARGHVIGVHTYFAADWHLARLQAGHVEYTCEPKRSRFDLRPIAALRRRYREFGPDVVIAFMRTPSFYAEALRVAHPAIPLIVSERAGVEAGGLKPADVLAGLGHLLASHLTANSHDTIDRLRKVLPIGRRSTAIYNGLEPRFFDAPDDETRRPRPFEAGSPPRFCVVAARVSRQKGPLPLARALKRLADQRVEFNLDWIGPTDETEPLACEVREFIEANGLATRWRWLGPEKDIVAAYRRYDALLLPSLYEGVANTMCEAMAQRRPVIVTAVADNRRIVRDGVEGFVCAPDDPESLAQAIGRFVDLPVEARESMGSAAQARAHELFGLERMVEQWESLCRALAIRT